MKLDYSPTVIDHFEHPRNYGELADANGQAMIGNPSCGDTIKIYLRIKNGIIEKAAFQTLGCVAAVAASSALTILVTGKTLQQAEQITNQQVAESLGGLPAPKMSCSNFAANALHAAIQNYKKSLKDSLEN